MTQFRIGVCDFSRSQLEHPQHRPPELAVRVDDDPRLAVGMAPDVGEQPDEVVDVRDEVGEDDVVERPVELDVLARPDLEAKLRMARPRGFDLAGADVDSHALRRRERGEQVAAAAADLEHGRPGLDDRLVESRDQLVVALARPPRAGRGELVEGVRDRGVGVGRRRAGHGGGPGVLGARH